MCELRIKKIMIKTLIDRFQLFLYYQNKSINNAETKYLLLKSSLKKSGAVRVSHNFHLWPDFEL